jgi:hypothetical protein
MRTLVLNSNNVVQDGLNNKLIFKFPNSAKFDKAYVAVASVSMYYSWFNVSAALGNNVIGYTWGSQAASSLTYFFTIPDGLYEISTLNQFLQFQFIKNGHYAINSAGQYVYFAEMIVNDARYKIQLNTFKVPTAAAQTALGYTQNTSNPPSASQTFNPIIFIPYNLGLILGWTSLTSVAGTITTASNTSAISVVDVNGGTTSPSSYSLTSGYLATDLQTNDVLQYNYPIMFPGATGSGTLPSFASRSTITYTISYLSNSTPNIQPNSSILISASSVDNPYSTPTSVIYSITPSVAVGEIISEKPPSFMWNKLIDGMYNQLQLTFLGNDLRPIQINDPAMTIILAIAQENEVLTK